MAQISKKFDTELVLNSIYNGIVLINTKGSIIYYNKTAERIFDIPAHNVLKRPIMKVLPQAGRKLLESLRTGNSFYGEKLQGKTVTLISNITPIFLKKNIGGAVSVFQELSEIEEISKELDFVKNMKDWLDTVIDSSYDGLWICDHEGKVVRINKAAERLNDVRSEDVVGKSMRQLIAEGLVDKSDTLETLKAKTSVTLIQTIKGRRKILATSNPIFNEKGEITFVVSNDRDIEEIDRLRSRLEESMALAKGYSSKLSELEMKGIDLSTILFRSLEMESLIQKAIRVASVDSAVLLLGEPGVGKGVIAKLIHRHSGRAKGPFIRVDCAGIPDSLFESELFGYDRGAFTGAKDEGKPGLFELAHGGTLFLDEIAEIPLVSQSKLLRFLEDHEMIRVGGTTPRKIDTRIIAATNRNVEEMVSSNLFRKDLYYRLNVIPLQIKPLRERKEDILALTSHFLDNFSRAYHRRKSLSPKVIKVLREYNFPGNVRELENLIERFVVLTEGERIEIDDLPDHIQKGASGTEQEDALPSEDISLREAMEKYERFIIEKALTRFGSQRKTSKILKVTQATISRKMRKYSIPLSYT